MYPGEFNLKTNIKVSNDKFEIDKTHYLHIKNDGHFRSNPVHNLNPVVPNPNPVDNSVYAFLFYQ